MNFDEVVFANFGNGHKQLPSNSNDDEYKEIAGKLYGKDLFAACRVTTRTVFYAYVVAVKNSGILKKDGYFGVGFSINGVVVKNCYRLRKLLKGLVEKEIDKGEILRYNSSAGEIESCGELTETSIISIKNALNHTIGEDKYMLEQMTDGASLEPEMELDGDSATESSIKDASNKYLKLYVGRTQSDFASGETIKQKNSEIEKLQDEVKELKDSLFKERLKKKDTKRTVIFGALFACAAVLAFTLFSYKEISLLNYKSQTKQQEKDIHDKDSLLSAYSASSKVAETTIDSQAILIQQKDAELESVSKYKKEKQEKDAELKELRIKAKDLDSKLKSKSAALEKANKDIDAAKSDNAKQAKANKALRDSVADLSKKLSRARADNNEKEQEIARLNSEAQNRSSSASVANNETSGTDEVSESDSIRQNADNARAALLATLSHNLESENTQLKERLGKKQEEISERDNRIASLEAETYSLRQQVSEKDNQLKEKTGEDDSLIVRFFKWIWEFFCILGNFILFILGLAWGIVKFVFGIIGGILSFLWHLIF